MFTLVYTYIGGNVQAHANHMIVLRCVLVQTELDDECLAYSIVFGSDDRDECFVGRSHLLGSIYRSFWISSVLPRNVF